MDQRLVDSTSTLVVDYLVKYLEGLLRSLYTYCRGGHLHTDSRTYCGLAQLDQSLDTLLEGLLKCSAFVKSGGLTLLH